MHRSGDNVSPQNCVAGIGSRAFCGIAALNEGAVTLTTPLPCVIHCPECHGTNGETEARGIPGSMLAGIDLYRPRSSKGFST